MSRSVLVVDDHESAAEGLAVPLRGRYAVTVAPSLNASNGRRAHLNTYAANSVVGGFNVDVLDIRATGAGLGPL